MHISDVLEIAAAIIASLGGGGAIVWGFSGYLGKIWADRGLERQKHEYSQLNIAFQSQLDVASRRLQIELDALGLVHKLRTQEEFNRLAGLWKRVANLRNSFAGLAQQGMTLTPGDPEERKKWNSHIRQQFDTGLNDALMFLAEEGLFIPKHICVVAESATRAATLEQFNFAGFRPYLETEVSTLSSRDEVSGIVEMRQHYSKAKTEAFKEFSEAIEQLETLMRRHIAGSADSSLPLPESISDKETLQGK
jgi:hypothetical protein